MNGHIEANCWKNNSDKAPQWFKDLKAGKVGARTIITIMLASVEYEPRLLVKAQSKLK